MAALAYFIEGPETIIRSIAAIDATTLLALAYIAYLTTIVGYAVWNRMLAEHAAVAVAPFALLTPVFGLLSAALILEEPYPGWKLGATLLIIAGLGLNQCGSTLQRLFSGKILS